MKQYITFLILFLAIFFTVNAQTQFQSGRVTYGFTEIESEFTENRDEIFDKLHKQGEDVTFILSFTKNKSFFSNTVVYLGW